MVSSPVQNPITDQEDPGDRDTILVVEDDPQSAAFLKELLEDEGHPVVLASTGAEGQRILGEPAISLVLLDLRLPDMNGMDLMRCIQQAEARPDIIIITAHASLESAVKAIENGAAGYVLKPIDPTHLRTLVDRILERRRLQRENAALYERVDRERRRLQVLYDVSRHLISVRDTDEILSLIVRETSRLLGAEAVALRLLEGEEFVLKAHTELAEALISRTRVPTRASLSGLVLAAGEPVVIEDLPEDTRHDPAYTRGVASLGFRGFLGVPLRSQGETIGALNVYTKDRRRFTPDETSLLSALADQASLAIDSARLFHQEQKRRRHLEAVRAIGVEITRELDVPTLLGLIIRRSIELVGADSGIVRLWDDSQGLLIPYSHEGMAPNRLFRLRPGEGVAGIVAQRRAGMIVNDFQTSADVPPHIRQGSGAYATVAQPLLYRDRLIGVISIFRETSARPFNEEDQAVLGLFAAQAAIAIENARLLAATEERARELETLREIGQAITARLDIAAVLEAVVAGAMRLLNNPYAQVIIWDEESQRLRYGAALGPEAERVRTQTFELGRGINGMVALTRQPMILDDYQTSPYALPGFPDIVATITVPVLFGDRLLGVLHSHATQPGRQFTTDDLRLLQLLADQAAVAIENARLLQEVEAQRAHLAQLFESASDAIVVANGRGNIFSWNRAAQHMFEYTEEEVLGRPLTLLMPESSREAHKSGLDRMRSGAEPHVIGKTVEFIAVRKGGTEFPIELSLAVLKASDGTYYSGIIRDITVRKQADQMKSDFVSFVTHQLRTPLAGIKWLLELAEQEPAGSEEARSYIQDARESNERLIRLVNELLDVSRLERGKLNIVPRETRLDELTQTVLDELKSLIAAKGHRLSFTAEGEVPLVWVDPKLLREAILNLMSNAIKYTRPGGEIFIRISRELATICWAIQDSGIGIPKEAQRCLFEKFYRAENALTLETEGTGLGLYLVRLILEQFGGRVWCESEEGGGSTFLFTLPLPGSR